MTLDGYANLTGTRNTSEDNMPNPNEYEARIYNSGPGTMGAYYHQVLASAIAELLAGSSQAQVHPEKPIYKYEKCYGVGRQV